MLLPSAACTGAASIVVVEDSCSDMQKGFQEHYTDVSRKYWNKNNINIKCAATME